MGGRRFCLAAMPTGNERQSMANETFDNIYQYDAFVHENYRIVFLLFILISNDRKPRCDNSQCQSAKLPTKQPNPLKAAKTFIICANKLPILFRNLFSFLHELLLCLQYCTSLICVFVADSCNSVSQSRMISIGFYSYCSSLVLSTPRINTEWRLWPNQ